MEPQFVLLKEKYIQEKENGYTNCNVECKEQGKDEDHVKDG
jgi:hypothetical protein